MKKARKTIDRKGPRSDAQIEAAAMSDPDAQPSSAASLRKARRVPEVKRLRWQLELTQDAFAERYGIPVATVRDWEQGRSSPDATARSFLRAIAKGPKQIAKLLEAAE
ncbi:helix-turn-helix domain-containing protein [Hyphomicrobium sp. 2TAF46]|uniref:helix-turn-helix domain-containing protein n=1 Tax=Hyphomicrobium sp. 2TAF46 TaxID=3233019 RepID=UPI003F8FD430